MPILDGVFISKAYRRQGWGTAMIEDLVNIHFPGQDIGFSQPISLSLESGELAIKLLNANELMTRFFSSFEEIPDKQSTSSE